VSARNIIGGITGLAVSAVKLPFTTAEKVLGHGKGAVAGAAAKGPATADTAAKKATETAKAATEAATPVIKPVTKPVTEPVSKAAGKATETASKASRSATKTVGTAARKAAQKSIQKTAETVEKAADQVEQTADKVEKAADQAASPSGAPEQKPAEQKPAAKKPAAKKPAAKKPAAKKGSAGPRPVTAADLPLPPNLPAEPPVDVVGQALAAEAQEPGQSPVGAGRATEPKPASRDEGHGEASLQPAERDEIAEEVAETTPAGSVGIVTPVGTTGADTGRNPSTAEADLQQPGTEPIVDPALTKTVKKAASTGRKASDSGKPTPSPKS
jgi:hypothetical protein